MLGSTAEGSTIDQRYASGRASDHRAGSDGEQVPPDDPEPAVARYDAGMPAARQRPAPEPLPDRIGAVSVPQDPVSAAAWRWSQRALPSYLLAHSVRSYCWGAAIADAEGWTFDRRILWTASLLHDLGLTRIPENRMCFEVEGAEIARRVLERHGLPAGDADRAAIAIILHMQPAVTLADGVESVLLDRATGIDVRGARYEAIEAVRDGVVDAFPRGSFDRLFLRAMEREVARRGDCQSARLLGAGAGLAADMGRSPWARSRGRPRSTPRRGGKR